MATSGYSFYTSGAPKQPEESTWKYHVRKLFTIKSMGNLEADQESSGLKRSLNALDLIMIGLGGIIGTGIFVLTGNYRLFHKQKKFFFIFIIIISFLSI
jgi:APA family basic amino acid/polyamine antiporter